MSRLELLKLMLDGGDSSGNFGHKGRPGKVGGSSKTIPTTTPEADRVYGTNRLSEKDHKALKSMPIKRRKAYLEMVSKEETTTKDMTSFNKKNGMTMIGEKFAIKSPGSFDRKISQLMDEKNMTEEQALDSIHDCVRYTSTTSPKNLVKRAEKTLKDLEKKGYTIVQIKNSWNDSDNPYKGINCKVVSPDGTKFELQFHTPQSFDMKERKQHKFYEEWRDKNTTEERKEELTQIMFDQITKNKKWTVPIGVENLKNFSIE